MLRGLTRGLSCLLLLSILLVPTACFGEEPVVDTYLLYSETCPHCHIVITEVLPDIEEKYGTQLNIMRLNLSEPDDFKAALVLETVYQVPPEQAGVPEVFVGTSVLIGANSIRDYLDEEIQTLLESGGYRLPTQQQLLDMIVYTEPTGEPTTPITETLESPVYTPEQVLETLEASTQVPSTEITGTLEANPPALTETGIEVAASSTATVTMTSELTEPPELTAGAKVSQPRQSATSSPTVATAAKIPTISVTTSPSVTSTTAVNPGSAKPMHVAYFYEVGCAECDRAKYALNYLQRTDYPNLIVDEFDVVEHAGLAKWLGDKYELPESEQLVTPVVFVGDEYLLESAITVNNLTPILDRYEKAGVEAIWDGWEADQGGNAVVGLFRNISLAAVIGAGLIDGVNPCAFATIVFFIAYLAFVGRKGRDLVYTGIAFTLGVFIAYLLLGLGLLKVLEVIDITSWGRYFYIVVAVICLVLAAANLLDFFKARRGKVEDMQLRLPTSLRRQINRVIREGSGVRAFVLVSFATGFVVSLIELACTGQVYVVILSALSHPSLRHQALGYLLVYNLAFVTPLVVVFLLAFFGVESGDLARFVERNTSTVKLLTALLFLGLGLWLIYAFLPLFGVHVLGS